MTNNAELNVTPPTEPARSAAALRMRRHRQRLRDGLQCLFVELRAMEVTALISKGLLNAEMRNDPIAVVEALYAHPNELWTQDRDAKQVGQSVDGRKIGGRLPRCARASASGHIPRPLGYLEAVAALAED